MALFLRRFLGQQLLVVPNRPHTSDEVTSITVKDAGPHGDLGFAFDIAPGYSICLGELYNKRHGDDLIESRCVECGVPLGLNGEEDRELHVAEGLCYHCWDKQERDEGCANSPRS